MTAQEREQEVRRIQLKGNEAKDRLYQMVTELEELGCIRKAKSLMTIIYTIEEWQNK